MKLSTGGYEIFVCEHREGVKYYFFSVTPQIRQMISTKNIFLKGDRESLNSVISFRAPRLPGEKNPLYLKPSLMMVGAREKLALADSSVTKPQRERTANLISHPQNPDNGKQARGSKRDFSNQRHSQSYSVKITLVFLIGQIHELKLVGPATLCMT